MRENQEEGAELFGPRLVVGLEVDPHTKFDLTRCVGLTRDIAERPWGVQSHARVASLELVQHVCELSEERHSNPLGELKLLGDAQVEVPRRQSAENAGAASVVVEAQDQPPESGVDRGWIAKHIDARAAVRWIGVRANGPCDH